MSQTVSKTLTLSFTWISEIGENWFSILLKQFCKSGLLVFHLQNLHQEISIQSFYKFLCLQKYPLQWNWNHLHRKLLATFTENSLSTFLYLLAWKWIPLFNKYCKKLGPNIMRQNLYLVTIGTSLKMSPNHKNL